jgi:putative ubiquitin-RnfH superfamily antitoxin RatB of RatAB toxin-antitoxin module
LTDIEAEVCYALADTQWLIEVRIAPGSTVAEAIAASGIHVRLATTDLSEMTVGIWGHPVSAERVVRHGDRVEIYRPLIIDPREARRQRAALGETMRKSGSG